MRVSGTYGLGTAVRSASGAPGGGLAGGAVTDQSQATAMLGQAADMETKRKIANQQAEQQAKAGGATAGAMAGAYYGSSFGPWGTAAGAVIGAIAGDSLF